MDSTDFPASRSPRKELQGQRPPALKVHKDSYKIKKPPVAPQPSQQQEHQQLRHHLPPPPHHQQQRQQQQTQPRQPVIIYTVSPKVIHINPSDFMTLVQRLTGSTSSSTSVSSNPINDLDRGGAISPAARYATIEKARSSPKDNKKQQQSDGDVGVLGGIDMGQIMERQSYFPAGILSPGPALLPQISPNYFSPTVDPINPVSFIHDLSPALHSNRNILEGSFMPSPSTYFTNSPTLSIDLFNNFNFNNIFDF